MVTSSIIFTLQWVIVVVFSFLSFSIAEMFRIHEIPAILNDGFLYSLEIFQSS